MGAYLYGVGVGPGDPELLTLKAARLLREADVIAVPDRDGESTALDIIKAYAEGKPLLRCPSPMTRDETALALARERSAELICERLAEGQNVVFATLGDPCVYSTYTYIHRLVVSRGFGAEIVPGVTSFCAAAARLGISLCEGNERLMLVPASGGDFSDCLEGGANLVFMKAGRALGALKRALAEAGLSRSASLVESCTLPQERVYESLSDAPEDAGYFSLAIAKPRGR